jgi:hypothetical protein
MVMKLINKTDYSVAYLRQIVKWISGEVGLNHSTHTLTIAPSRTRTWSFSWDTSRQATVFIGKEERFPRPAGHKWPALQDRDTALVFATGCVLSYFAQYQDSRGYNRGATYAKARALVARFPEVRASLGAAAMKQDDVDLIYAKAGVDGFELVDAPAVPAKIVLTPAQKRARKVEADLVRWQRKLKLAQGKIKKLKKQSAYYARTLGAS